jgi:hypothetical protein
MFKYLSTYLPTYLPTYSNKQIEKYRLIGRPPPKKISPRPSKRPVNNLFGSDSLNDRDYYEYNSNETYTITRDS